MLTKIQLQKKTTEQFDRALVNVYAEFGVSFNITYSLKEAFGLFAKELNFLDKNSLPFYSNSFSTCFVSNSTSLYFIQICHLEQFVRGNFSMKLRFYSVIHSTLFVCSWFVLILYFE